MSRRFFFAAKNFKFRQFPSIKLSGPGEKALEEEREGGKEMFEQQESSLLLSAALQSWGGGRGGGGGSLYNVIP